MPPSERGEAGGGGDAGGIVEDLDGAGDVGALDLELFLGGEGVGGLGGVAEVPGQQVAAFALDFGRGVDDQFAGQADQNLLGLDRAVGVGVEGDAVAVAFAVSAVDRGGLEQHAEGGEYEAQSQRFDRAFHGNLLCACVPIGTREHRVPKRFCVSMFL
ncbi:MAG: hypothetical protein M5U26_28845 [Planctomycetota bacterium]|nr:hypothetical protein [Planctomycetota bacterium]